MKKKIDSDKITLDGIPFDHAYEAYKAGYYFESIAVLHGYIEGQMKSLYHMYVLKMHKEPIPESWYAETWDATDRLSFIMIAHVLFVSSLITKNEYDVLVSLNTLRNSLMHRFFTDTYNKIDKGVSKTKFHSCIKSADKVLITILEKADNLMEP